MAPNTYFLLSKYTNTLNTFQKFIMMIAPETKALLSKVATYVSGVIIYWESFQYCNLKR